MKRKWIIEEQIMAVLKEGDGGTKVIDVCGKYGINIRVCLMFISLWPSDI